MPNGTNRDWNHVIGEVGSRVDEDLRHLVQYINDEIVPAVRRNGPGVLRQAAAELQKIADRMEDRAASQRSKDTAKP